MSDTVKLEGQMALRRLGSWLAGIPLTWSIAVAAAWLVISDPAMRRGTILVLLGCALMSVLGLLAFRRALGGRATYASISRSMLDDGAGELAHPSSARELPERFPSRAPQMRQSVTGAVGVWTILMALVAMAMGSPDRPDQVSRISAAGGEFGHVRVDQVKHTELRDPSRGKSYYEQVLVVELPGADGSENATIQLETEGPDRVDVGDDVAVFYAPSAPEIGAVAGTQEELAHVIAGDALSGEVRWLLLGAWVLGLCMIGAVYLESRGFRVFGRMRPEDGAVRGEIIEVARFGSGLTKSDGEAKWRGFAVKVSSLRTAHFLVDVAHHEVPSKVQGEKVWLCWDGKRGARGRRFSFRTSPATLISDSGWVIHGMLPVSQGVGMKKEHGMRKKGDARDESGRSLRLWNPRAFWPLYISGTTLGSYVLAILVAALMTFDVPSGWRLGVGIVSPLVIIVMIASYMADVRPPEKAK